jgi:pilus assembly protein Flp/PilA
VIVVESIKLVAEYVSHLPVVRKIAPALANRRGVTALEYGLIASLVAVIIIASFGKLGTAMGTLFDGIATQLNNPTSAGTGTGTGG